MSKKLTIIDRAQFEELVSSFIYNDNNDLSASEQGVVNEALERLIDHLYPKVAFELPVEARNVKGKSRDGVSWFIRDANGDNIAVGLGKATADRMVELMNANYDSTDI